jgi:hypothetical protein
VSKEEGEPIGIGEAVIINAVAVCPEGDNRIFVI